MDITQSNSTMTTGTDEESATPPASIEEGVVPSPKLDNGVSQRLSAVSKKYDIDGDGKLDETEQAMRDMDKEGLGYLTNDKVYSIFQQQIKMQKQLLIAKRLLIFFAVFLVLLAIANIAVAFTAARLSKDTTAQNNVLVVKETGEVVATNTHAITFDITSQDAKGIRSLETTTGSGTTSQSFTTVTPADASAMYTACSNGQTVILQRSWADGSLEVDPITICPASRERYIPGQDLYKYELTNGRGAFEIDCMNNDPCIATGDVLLQQDGEYCAYDSDCVAAAPHCYNNACTKCQPPPEVICITLSDPQCCGGCEYSNTCVTAALGLNGCSNGSCP